MNDPIYEESIRKIVSLRVIGLNYYMFGTPTRDDEDFTIHHVGADRYTINDEGVHSFSYLCDNEFETDTQKWVAFVVTNRSNVKKIWLMLRQDCLDMITTRGGHKNRPNVSVRVPLCTMNNIYKLPCVERGGIFVAEREERDVLQLERENEILKESITLLREKNDALTEREEKRRDEEMQKKRKQTEEEDDNKEEGVTRRICNECKIEKALSSFLTKTKKVNKKGETLFYASANKKCHSCKSKSDRQAKKARTYKSASLLL